jgi:hypothetical protein
MNVIREYVERYYEDLKSRDMSYSEVASLIYEDEDTDLSHRTIRLRVSQIFNEILNKKEYASFRGGNDAIPDAKIKIKYWVEPNHNSWNTYNKSALQPYLNGNPDNVLIIGDPHEPFCLDGYMEHCLEQQKKYNCGTVICIGDIIDNHYSSFHDADPDGWGGLDELERTVLKTREWHRVFPNAICTIGNHDAIVMRKAFKSGLSNKWIKGLSEVLEMPTWKFVESHEHNGVLYTHTLGGNLLNAAMARRQSVVCGHLHTKAEIQWNVNKFDRVFSMQVGCGINDKAYAFAYAKLVAKKSIIACGVVLGDIPTIIPMNL